MYAKQLHCIIPICLSYDQSWLRHLVWRPTDCPLRAMETDSGAAGAEGQELEVADDIEASSVRTALSGAEASCSRLTIARLA